ncbi:hypothetical protein Poli38472_002874 [Pythium oligandrum]|uniref:Uncharacterized protein n=1 Tax=Pythium oligandrum TaxID=41045 RepID=A0A8K1C5I6_PYTOL|nr:hypothetical protein Poli38472_002874 [Pythium oligandrum]|eukprot:TMW56949.1 hypothetical protein Poli38472_002874 [Pythium oligandrum]
MGVVSGKRKTFMVLVTLAALFAIATAQDATNTTASGCEICRDEGKCGQAFQAGPGQFCGNWLSKASERHACCCPTNAVCYNKNNYECRCQPAKGSSSNSNSSTNKPEEKKKTSWVFILIGVLIAGALIGGVIYFCMRRKDEEAETTVTYVVEQPAYVAAPPPNQYGNQYGGQPGYGQAPVYAPAPVYHHQSPQRSGPGMGAGVAVGAAAGLVGGLIISDMINDAGDNGGSGGYEDEGFAGDF